MALDCDAIEPGEVAVFMPERGGLALADVEAILGGIASRTTVIGAGLSGLVPEAANVLPLTRLLAALGL